MSRRMLAVLQSFRVIAFLEGVSFLVLLGIAMPLKYYADLPIAVRVVGSLHGLLFVAYAAVTGLLFMRGQWSVARGAVAMGASLLPFGTFLFDRSVKREVGRFDESVP
jgi:integral membrane protein